MILESPMPKRFGLLGVNSDAKTKKGTKRGYVTAILYLAPAQEASPKNLCPYSSPGCRLGCLYKAGRGAMKNVESARVNKTLRYLNDRAAFMLALSKDIERFRVAAIRRGFIPCVRLNGTTDILWERVPVARGFDLPMYPNLMAIWPELQFYDYSKVPPRYRINRPDNYDLTFSRAEDNEQEALRALQEGFRVAAVWRDKLPRKYLGFKVYDADADDLRFLDPVGVWSGLLAKGPAKIDLSGFVIDGRN